MGVGVVLQTLWVIWTHERASTSRIQGHSTADTAINRTLLEDSGSYSHLRGRCREYDCSHLTMSLCYLPFHSVLWPALQRLDCLFCFAITSIILQPAQVFVSVLFSDSLLDWKLFGTRIQLPNALTSKQDPMTALRNPKSSRSQTIRLKQHYDTEAEMMYPGLFLFTQ